MEDSSDEDILQLPAFGSIDDFDLSSGFSGLKQDGEKTGNSGPCKCGQKHWVDGKEFDFAFKWPNFDGLMGFNLGDNAYIAAEKFVLRYDDHRDSLNHRNHVNMIANAILKHIAQFEPVRIDKPKPVSTFDPYKTSLHYPVNNTTNYNKVTNKFEKTVYAMDRMTNEEKAELQKRHEESEANKRKVNKEIEDEKKIKNEITNRIRIDQQEVEKEREMKKMLSGSTPSKPKSSGTVAVVGEDGNLKWVDRSEISPSKNTYEGSIRSLKDPKPEKPHFQQESDSDDEDPLEAYDGYPPKEAWTIPLLIQCLRSEGHKATEQRMLKSGFTESECSKYIQSVAMLLAKASLNPDRMMFSQPSESEKKIKDRNSSNNSAFNGKGFTLGSSNDGTKKEVVPSDSTTEPQKSTNLTVDDSQPRTSVRVRLTSGKQETIELNHTHTVQQLVDHLRGFSVVTTFQLKNMGSFPPKVIVNMSETIKEANLLNGNLVQFQ